MPQIARMITAPTIAPMKPAPSLGPYQPNACPRYVDTTAPTMPRIVVRMKPGDSVKADDALLELHHRGGRNLDAALALCRDAISIGDEPPVPRLKILGEVR